MRRRLLTILASAALCAAACTESSAPPLSTSTLPDSAEQMAFGVHLLLTDQGVRHGVVDADTALMYEDNTRTELRQLKTTFFTPSGVQNAVLTARAGTYLMRTGYMDARGNVVVISNDGRKLETQQLRYDQTRNEISSDSAFTLTQTDRVLQGIGFISDPDMNNIKVLRGAKASGQAVTIPKR